MTSTQNHERYFRTHSGEPYYFHVSFDDIVNDMKWIEENGIENIKLCQYDPFFVASLESILKIKIPVKRLQIHIKNADLSQLPLMSDLEELSIGEPGNIINLTGLIKLKKLYLTYSKKVFGFSNLQNLEELVVLNAEIPFFSKENFKNLNRIRSLSIYSSQLPNNLDFINSLILKEIEFYNIRSFFCIKSLVISKDTLEVLKIGKCSNVDSIEETLPKLVSLRWLELIDSIILNDTHFVDIMPKLKVLIILGNSFFKNGDLSNLLALEHVSIDNKRHYTLKHEYLPKLPIEKSNFS